MPGADQPEAASPFPLPSAAILEHTSDAIFIVDHDWRFTYLNPQAEQLLQRRRDDLLGQVAWDVLPEAVGSSFYHRYQQAVATTEPVAFEAFSPSLAARFEVRAYPSSAGLVVYFQDITARRASEEALRAREEHYRTLFATMTEGVVYQDASGAIIDVNPAAAELLGLTREQLLGRTSTDARWRAVKEDGALFPGEEHPAMVALRTGQAVRDVTMGVYHVARGALCWLLVDAVPQYRPGEERPYQVYTLFRDITAQRRVEAALRESEDRFRVALKHSPIAVYHTDRELRYTWLYNLHPDFRAEEMLGKRDDELVPSEQAAPQIALKQQVLTQGAGVRGEFSVPLSDGLRTYDVTAEPLRDATGAVVGVTVAALDITERERLLAELRTAEARYRGLFEGVGDALLVADATGQYVDANPAAGRLLGYTAEELLGLNVADVMMLSQDETRAMYAQFVREGQWRGEVELRRKDGTLVPVEGRATALALPAGMLYVSALRDITERRTLEREREHFLAAISHDLKTPLTAIHGMTQLVQRQLGRTELPEAAQLAARLDSVVTATLRMTGLLNELLDQARLRGGQALELARQPLDLVPFVRKLASEYRLATEGHRLVSTIAVPTLVASVDAARLDRVLQNLLGNAVKYSHDSGTITLGVAREEGLEGAWAVLAVRDEGVGIPAADLPHIFDHFRRGGNVVGLISGTGLGLATARQIVEAHGGWITVASVEGQGTTVTVRLPLLEQRA